MPRWALRRIGVALVAAGLALPAPLLAQALPPRSAPATPAAATGVASAFSRTAAEELKGRTVEDVQVRGNTQVSTAVILNLVRTHKGESFDPATVAEDYQRIYTLRKFSNVEATVEPTATGVIVAFIVTEQKQVKSIRFKGNNRVDAASIKSVVDLKAGEAIDSFRTSLARTAIENLYRDKNFPLAHVTVDEKSLNDQGEVVFNIVEGPNTRIRKLDFIGAKSFSKDKLSDQIKTGYWIFIFRAGKYDPEQVEEDVAALRRFYESKGFFDVRVGRKLVWSPDLSEMEVDFVIDEGQRYKIDKVTFLHNTGVSEGELRSRMKLLEGRAYDGDILQRDTREIVRAYSDKRLGYIYQPQSNDPDYLRIETKPVFKRVPGHIELIYDIHEGRRFRVGNIYVKGNTKSQDILVLREFRNFAPGDEFNSAEFQDAADRLRKLPYFATVTMTPIGDDPNVRDVLVEVSEQHTASFNIGAGVNSNGGVGGNISYEQRNFDLGNLPAGPGDIFSDRAFTGRGQDFRASLEPGTQQTNASLRFSEPWLFDQPYGFSNELYLRDRVREHYLDRRIGDTVTLSKRFDFIWTGAVSLRGEQVKIHGVDDEPARAPEIVNGEGHSVLTSVAVTIRRDTTNPGIFPDRGTVTSARWESYGAVGGDYSFQKFTLGWDGYKTVHEDLLDRKTVLGLHANVGYITGNSVFFERFYGGGIGSIRGFRFRGVSPRSGPADDPIGGDFSATGTAELNFPLVGESLRAVVFTDAGTVERSVELRDLRASIGTGVRLILPFLGQTPLAIDFAVPVAKARHDDTQFVSFSFGFIQ